jgi:hypothetical protein
MEQLEPRFNKNEILERLMDDGLLKPGQVDFENFSDKNKNDYWRVDHEIRSELCKTWTLVMQKNLSWRKPHIVNGWVTDEIYESPYKKLWVLPRMLSVGAQEYIVRYP